MNTGDKHVHVTVHEEGGVEGRPMVEYCGEGPSMSIVELRDDTEWDCWVMSMTIAGDDEMSKVVADTFAA